MFANLSTGSVILYRPASYGKRREVPNTSVPSFHLRYRSSLELAGNGDTFVCERSFSFAEVGELLQLMLGHLGRPRVAVRIEQSLSEQTIDHESTPSNKRCVYDTLSPDTC